MTEIKHKPCPFCGSTKLHYQSSIQNGHGDCTFEGWIECECGARNGFVGDWGHPTSESEHKSWCKWDGVARPYKPPRTKLTKEEMLMLRLMEKYGKPMSLLEFINLVNYDKGQKNI